MPKSTLAEANEKKDWRIYQYFVQVLIRQVKEAYKGQELRFDFDEIVYVFDSSTTELCQKLYLWVKFHHERGVIKIFVYLTEGAVRDSKILDKIPVEANSYYLMDKGYVKFDSSFWHFHLNKVT